jgi:type I restriction enzyme S subunit
MIVSINGTLGKVAFYNDEKIILGKSACYFNVKESLINKTYLFHLLESQYFMDYALNMATGSTIKNVSLKSMRNFPIPLPPIDLQEKFCNRMNRIATIKLKINEALSKQTKLFNSLQNQAFSGQL